MKKRTIKIAICAAAILCVVLTLVYLFFIPKHVQLTIAMQQKDSISRKMLDNYADMTLDFEYYPRVASHDSKIHIRGTLKFNGIIYSTLDNIQSMMNSNAKWDQSPKWSYVKLDNIIFIDTQTGESSLGKTNQATLTLNLYEGDVIFLNITDHKTLKTEYWRTSFTSLDPNTRRVLCEMLHVSESEIGSSLRERQATEPVSG